MIVQEYSSFADAQSFANRLGFQDLGEYNGSGVVSSGPLNPATTALRILFTPHERKTLSQISFRLATGGGVLTDTTGTESAGLTGANYLIPVDPGTGGKGIAFGFSFS